MNGTQIWLAALTIFVAIQAVSDLCRWQRVGDKLRELSAIVDVLGKTQKSVLEYNQMNTEIVSRLAKAPPASPQPSR